MDAIVAKFFESGQWVSGVVVLFLFLAFHWLKDGAPFKFVFTRVSRKIETLRINLKDEHTPDYLKANLQQELDGWLFYQTYGFLPKNQKLCQALAEFKADTQFSDLDFKRAGSLIEFNELGQLDFSLCRIFPTWMNRLMFVFGLFYLMAALLRLSGLIEHLIRDKSNLSFFVVFVAGFTILMMAGWSGSVTRSARKLKEALIGYCGISTSSTS